MFDRLLGPKTDHADPKVRAKAFGHESVEQTTINEALKTESDSDVLCVILNRADDVPTVLRHASGSDGSIANQARTRLVTLAETGAGHSADDWAEVYGAARSGAWTQLPALNDVLGPEAGRESVVQGALQALPETHELSERVLFTLATQSGGTMVRRLAARRIHSRQLMESCCEELKDKDKTAFRELKERVDALQLEDERRELADKLKADCDTLAELRILAQPESVAVAQSRKQTLEQRISELNRQAPDIASSTVDHLARVGEAVERTLQEARSHVENRKALRSGLTALNTRLSDETAETDADAASELERIQTAWAQIPDHTDLEEANFEREVRVVSLLAHQRGHDHDIVTGLNARIDQWEKQAEDEAPLKLLARIQREWDSAEKPRSGEQLDSLQMRIEAVKNRLEQREKKLAEKRANNSKQLLSVLDEFVVTMEKGEFKKAMSLNDKLRARAANRDLEAAARKKIEDALKQAQPKLEEFRKWRHFGTVQARENLIGQANTLVSDPPPSPKVLANDVKALRESWRKLDQDDGRASEDLWQTFNTACKEAYKPAKKHFDQLSKERKTNLAGRKKILDSLEALLKDTDWSSPDWHAVTQSHKDLIIQWQRSGTVDYKVKKKLDTAFDDVARRFDEQFREERESEVLRRRRLIDRLKAQKEAESGGRLAGEAKRAQREWRPTVQSDRKTEQELWEEFRGVCDEIFGSLKQQQKEAKAAWQADAGEREKLCEQIDALLDGADSDDSDIDRPMANQAKGQLQEFARRWRERHQIPSGVKAKLDRRYKQARQGAEERIESVIRRDENRAAEKLDACLDLCQRAEEALLTGTFDAAEFEAHLAGFDALRGAVGKALQKRYAQVLKGMAGDAAAVDGLKAALTDNLSTRQELCLLGELVADIESPAQVEKERMALRMKRLTEAMQGELPAPHKELADIVNQWYLAGGVSADDWFSLNERFARVRAARSGGRA